MHKPMQPVCGLPLRALAVAAAHLGLGLGLSLHGTGGRGTPRGRHAEGKGERAVILHRCMGAQEGELRDNVGREPTRRVTPRIARTFVLVRVAVRERVCRKGARARAREGEGGRGKILNAPARTTVHRWAHCITRGA